LTVLTTDREWHACKLANEHVWKAVRVYCHVFSGMKALHKAERFNELALWTHTSGHYLKTAILRTSAAESEGQYRVHLVPFFASHAELCRERFEQTHPNRPPGFPTGDLIGWLGERELDGDKIEFGCKTNDNDTSSLVASFNLQRLADDLDEAWLHFERHGWKG
jgi:hypothetical protein